MDDKAPFRSLGEQLVAVAQAVINQRVDPRLLAAASGLSEGVPSDGGFVVQTDFAAQLWERMYEVGALLARVTRIPIGLGRNRIKVPTFDETSRADGARFGGVRAYWAVEAEQATKSKPRFGLLGLELNKLLAIAYATDELVADAGALEAVLRKAFGDEAAFVTEDAMVNGNGAGKPLGIMNSGALITVDKETGQLANTVVVENVVKMWARMWAPSRRRAVWLINQDLETELLTSGITFGTGGQALYRPPISDDDPFGRLMGRPVIPVEYGATLGTTGDIIFADFDSYIVADKAPDFIPSIDVRFDFAETAFRFTYRLDGQPAWAAAVTPKNGTATLSPFVALETRG